MITIDVGATPTREELYECADIFREDHPEIFQADIERFLASLEQKGVKG
jgi:hypothetical protein